jgi:plastocyanin
MKRCLAATIACAALTLTAGCGSSGSASTTGAGSTAAVTSSAGAPSASTSSTGASSTAKQPQKGGLQATTTPKYASPSPSEPVQSGVVQIAYRNIAIDPDTVRVKVGSTVRWTNYDPVTHNVTSQSGPTPFASKNFGEGQTFEVKLPKPGVIHYLSTNYPVTMNGTIEVVE